MRFLAHVLLFFIGIPVSMYSGLILSDLWNWFLVGPFVEHTITALQGWGVVMTISFVLTPITIVLVSKIEERGVEDYDTGKNLQQSLNRLIAFVIVLPFLHAYFWVIHSIFW